MRISRAITATLVGLSVAIASCSVVSAAVLVVTRAGDGVHWQIDCFNDGKRVATHQIDLPIFASTDASHSQCVFSSNKGPDVQLTSFNIADGSKLTEVTIPHAHIPEMIVIPTTGMIVTHDEVPIELVDFDTMVYSVATCSLQTGKVIRTIKVPPRTNTDQIVRVGEDLLASTSLSADNAQLFSSVTGAYVASLPKGDPRGRLIAADKTLYAWTTGGTIRAVAKVSDKGEAKVADERSIALDAEIVSMSTITVAEKSAFFVAAGDKGRVAKVMQIDPATLKIVTTAPVPTKTHHVRPTPDGSSFWLLDEDDGNLKRFDATSGKIVETIESKYPSSGRDVARMFVGN